MIVWHGDVYRQRLRSTWPPKNMIRELRAQVKLYCVTAHLGYGWPHEPCRGRGLVQSEHQIIPKWCFVVIVLW